MSYVRVVSKRAGGKRAHEGETVIDVDRSHPVLGNRHRVANHNDEAQRQIAIAKNREDMDADFAVKGPIFGCLSAIAKRVVAGERIALRCWCGPKACHADNYQDGISRILGRDVRPPDERACLTQAIPEPAQGSLF